MGIIGIIIILMFVLPYFINIPFPEIDNNLTITMALIIGLFTSLHCVGMCGGFILSYSTKTKHKSKIIPNLQYSVGKLISYTVIGGLFGFIGSFFIFSPLVRGVAGVLAGLFLLLFGLKMVDIFPSVRKFRMPVPNAINKIIYQKSSQSTNPLIIGLLNGLMLACGPLQAMYLLAATTGSVVSGGLFLFFFGLGTLPLMLFFGIVTTIISKTSTNKILRYSGVLVIVFGILMLNTGLALSGSGFDLQSISTGFRQKFFPSESQFADSKIDAEKNIQIITMEVNRYGWEPDVFRLKKGIPVKWIINGKEINNCNNEIVVPGLNIKFKVRPGQQIVEFIPEKVGQIPWSCWMGMIPGTFIVEEPSEADDQDTNISNKNNDLTTEKSDDSQELVESLEKIPKAVTSVSSDAPLGGACTATNSCGAPSCGASSGGSCGCGG